MSDETHSGSEAAGRASAVCQACRHSLANNEHGIDQDDFIMDECGDWNYVGACKYCNICYPRHGSLGHHIGPCPTSAEMGLFKKGDDGKDS